MKKRKFLIAIIFGCVTTMPSLAMAKTNSPKATQLNVKNGACGHCVVRCVHSYDAYMHWCGYNDYGCVSNAGSQLVGCVKECHQ